MPSPSECAVTGQQRFERKRIDEIVTGLARMEERKHDLADLLVGAAIGSGIGISLRF